MRKQTTYQTRKIFFKQWKRTSWAVFASLKVVVHNCCKNISSFKDSLMKQQGADRSELMNLSDRIDTLLELEPDIEFLEKELLLEYLSPKISTSTITKEVSLLLSSYYTSLLTNSKKSVGIFYISVI